MAKRGNKKKQEAPLSLGKHTVGGRVGKPTNAKTGSALTSDKSLFDKRIVKQLKNNELFNRLTVPSQELRDGTVRENQTKSSNSNSQSNGAISIRGIAGPTNVVIENLAPGTSSDDVAATLLNFGEILNCQVNDSQGKVRASVRFSTLASAQQVVQKLDGVTADGFKLSCYIKKNSKKRRTQKK
ncbi:RNA-binding protein [Schizosaccharomyces pombe]